MPTTLADFDHVRDTRLRRLLSAWLDARGDRMMPTRDDIDPATAEALGSDLWLCELKSHERRFHYRVAGASIASLYGDIVVGKYLDELVSGRTLSRMTTYYSKVLQEPSIGFVGGWLYADSDAPIPGERLALPLSDDGLSAHMILGATVTTEARGDTDAERLKRQVIVFTPVY